MSLLSEDYDLKIRMIDILNGPPMFVNQSNITWHELHQIERLLMEKFVELPIEDLDTFAETIKPGIFNILRPVINFSVDISEGLLRNVYDLYVRWGSLGMAHVGIQFMITEGHNDLLRNSKIYRENEYTD